jgi:prepilin-type N-terminal cleavage/methylation domain-containing protein
MTDERPSWHPRRRSAFTLIEIVAVVAIFAMAFGIAIPRLGRSNFDPLKEEAENIAQSLRFARQRAVMTGIPHRLLIDLEEGGYRIEWYVTETRAFGGSNPSGFASLLGADSDQVEDDTTAPARFSPRRQVERSYHPIPHTDMGQFRWLEDALYFVGIEGSTGWIEGGDYSIVFFEDGTTEPLLLELADAEDHFLTLELEAILDRVRTREGHARS